MKKMFLIIMMFVLFTINVKATTIEKIYIDAETEIAGGLKIKELVKVTNQDEPININIFYKDKSLSTKSLDGSSLKENAIYNGSGVLLSKIGVIKDPLFADEYSDASFYDSYVTPIEMKYNDTGENYIVTLNSSKKENIYYIEYTVLNVLVEHKDCAELYYRFIDNFNYNVKSITVITKLPYHSDLFKVWAHGSKNTVVSIDGKSSMVHNEITNYKKGEYLDNRILFDLKLFALNVNENKKSNIEAINLIKAVEKERISNTKINNMLETGLLLSVLILVTLIISFGIYKTVKKNKASTLIMK